MTQARDAKKKTVDSPELRKREEHQPDEASRQHPLLHLQRLAGNRAVVHLLESHGQLQTKLRASEPGDQHEQEADRAAVQVLRLAPAPGGVVQRKCADCSPGAKCAACAEEEETIQRKAKSASGLSSTVPQIQRAPRNGNSPTPDAATEPTAVASAAGPLIVEDDAATVAPGQMRKSEFLEQLRSTVCTTADEALAEAGQSTDGCPYIEQWLSYYTDQAPAHIERAMRKYAPEAASATSARDYIPAVSNRVRRAVATWARTGEITGVPDELKGMLPGSGGALGAVAGMIGGALSGIGSAIGSAVSAAAGAVGSAFSSIGSALFKRKEGHEGASAGATNDPGEIQQRLSGGQPLDGGAKSRMGAAFGMDFSGVRVHTDAEAAGLSDSLNARAFTIGRDIAFGPGEYQPGTLIGEALIAHELAHVVQQGGGSRGGPLHKGGATSSDSLEEEADVAALGAVSTLWLGAQGALADIGRHAMPRLASGLQLQRCPSGAATSATRPRQPSATCTPNTPAQWTRQVNDANAMTDAARKRAALGALVEQALCSLNIAVHIAGHSNANAVDPADYEPAPVINFDIDLEGKNRWGRTGRAARTVGQQPGYYFSSGSTAYAIIGPLAIDPRSVLFTRNSAGHELYHAQHHVRSPEGEDDNSELETWTHDFRSYFHQYLQLPLPQRPQWEPLITYYESSNTTDGPRQRALDQLVDYYNNPPGTTEDERRRVRTQFARWHHRRFSNDPSRRLLIDLDSRLHLSSP